MPLAVGNVKTCTKCMCRLPLSAFTHLSSAKDGLREHCKECAKVYNAKYFSSLSREEKDRRLLRDYSWKRQNKHKLRKSWHKALLKKYGLTVADYNNMLVQQNNVCCICKQPETSKINDKTLPLAVDHNHKTGQVRGLLCGKCNKALGGFNDDPNLLQMALSYLANHGRITS